MSTSVSIMLRKKVITVIALLVLLVAGTASVRLASANTNSLYDTLAANGELSSFATALQANQLDALLRNNGPFTVFAPTNAALAAAGGNVTRQDLLYHIVPGRLSAGQVAGSTSLNTAFGQPIGVSAAAGQALLNSSVRITTADIQATNGVIHIIDAVLARPGSGTPQPGPQPQPGPGPVVPGPAADGTTVVNVTNQVALANTKRFGINVGARSQYGAAQLLKNLVPNPGFEPAEFAMIFMIQPGSTATRFQADNWETRWNNDGLRIGQPVGFWDGASFEVISGAAKGRSGSIASFTHDGGRYTFNINDGGAAPNPGDAIVVRKGISGFDANLNTVNRGEPADKRPGSPGVQSLRLLVSSGWLPAWRADFDTYARGVDPTAGKLIQIQGNWVFEIWAKGTTANSTLRVTFERLGGAVFINETIPLSQGWQQIRRPFFASPEMDAQVAGVPGGLSLRLYAGGGDVLIDDVNLQRTDYTNPTVFSDRYVQALRELRPGVLRNWGEQLGSSLDNQLATTYARKPSGYSPKDRVATQFHYSLHEFLQLAQQVGAEPWYVIPPSWTPADLQNLMAYLSAPAGSHPYANVRAALGQNAPWTSVFTQIHLEYGNEIWGAAFGGDPFLGATMRGGVRAGQVANDRIGIMKGSPYYTANKFNFVIGGQARFTDRQREFEANSRTHDSIGFAPYYGELNTWQDAATRFNPLYAHSSEINLRGLMNDNRNILRSTGQGTEMVIYELNVHAITGAAPADIRNDFLTSQGAGISLPLTMLTYQRDYGIRTQVGFKSAQFSSRLPNGQIGRVFGMLRDIEATTRKRPTWLGMELANKAIGGNMLVTQQNGPTYVQAPINGILAPTETPIVQSFAFQQGGRYAVVLFNLDIAKARNVQLNLPVNPGSSATLYTLAANNISDDNETFEAVRIVSAPITNFSQSYNVTLQPHSMIVIEWGR